MTDPAVFSHYARYYDLLYYDKDYTAEANYVDRLIQRWRPGAKTVLELGSGTGKHAQLLAQLGYSVHGVDRSEGMLARANRSVEDRSQADRRPTFSLGDIRTVRVGRTFDAAISLFHVLSYQISNADVASALATAREHLEPGGIFIFDVWYGPAVLTTRPSVRVKRIEDDQISVTRLAEPVLRPNDNVVEVNYHVFVRERHTGNVTELRETHEMRYFFTPEIELLAQASGFSVLYSEEWMTGDAPGWHTWGACFVLSRH